MWHPFYSFSVIFLWRYSKLYISVCFSVPALSFLKKCKIKRWSLINFALSGTLQFQKVCHLVAPFIRILIFIHEIINRMPSPEVQGPKDGEDQIRASVRDSEDQGLLKEWLPGKTGDGGSEAGQGRGRSGQACFSGEIQSWPDPQWGMEGALEPKQNFRVISPHLGAKDTAFYIPLSVSHCLGDPQPGGQCKFSWQAVPISWGKCFREAATIRNQDI